MQHWREPGGAGVWLIEVPDLPMVDVQIDFDAGSRRDPAPQAGLAAAAALMLERGVAAATPRLGAAPGPFDAALDENALADAWADLGASFDASAGRDRLSLTLRSLTDPALLPQVLALAARQMAEPSFDAAVWARERERWAAALREADTRPGTVATRRFEQAVYGSHPYGAQVTPQSLAAIGVDDLRRWHGQRLRACDARVSIVGAVDVAQAQAIARALLARLPAGDCGPSEPLPEVAPLAAPADMRVPFDAAQAHVRIGQPGFRRDDPDFFALTVGNHILGGGGFTSRLSQAVREQRGLSYSVYSYFAPGRHAGAFTLGLQTRPDQAAEAVRVARETVARFVAEGPTEAELQAAKDNLVGGFALRLDSNRKLLDQLANIAWNDLPPDYLARWSRQVQALTVDDVRRAMQRVLQPERMVTVVVGGRP